MISGQKQVAACADNQELCSDDSHTGIKLIMAASTSYHRDDQHVNNMQRAGRLTSANKQQSSDSATCMHIVSNHCYCCQQKAMIVADQQQACRLIVWSGAAMHHHLLECRGHAL